MVFLGLIFLHNTLQCVGPNVRNLTSEQPWVNQRHLLFGFGCAIPTKAYCVECGVQYQLGIMCRVRGYGPSCSTVWALRAVPT